MLRLFKRIWRSLKEFLEKLFGIQSTTSRRSRRRTGEVADSTSPLTDTDYEFLYYQLLEGVAHGWHEGRILKFFEQLEERGKQRQWVAWLERFGEKLLASPSPNLPLAARMMRLGELAQSFGAIEQIGQASYKIGRQLYARESQDTIWEFEGDDIPGASLDQSEITGIPSNLATQTLSLDELLTNLQQDSQLAETIAQQLGLDNSDPQTIIQKLVQQFQAAQGEVQSQLEPQTVEDWFNLGSQQANLGDLEGAIASWDQALALNPQFTQAWHNRGSALGELGRMEEALESFEKAIQLNPEDPQTWNMKGRIFYLTQQLEMALACWEQSVELQPDLYESWHNRGCVLEDLGRVEEAIKSYTKALEIEPTFEFSRSRLDDLLKQQQSGEV